MKYLVLILLAILPVFLIAAYIYKKDTEKEPNFLLFMLFTFGVISAILVIIVNIIMETTIPFFRKDFSNMNPLELFVYILIGIGLIEEGVKWLISKLIGFKSKHFDQPYDIIVYTTYIALGFACFENILYVFEYGIQTAILRALTSIPGHTCFGIVMGYYLLLAKLAIINSKKKAYYKNLLLSFGIPLLFHTIYDYFLFLGNIILIFILVIAFIIFLFKSNKKLKEIASLSSKLLKSTK